MVAKASADDRGDVAQRRAGDGGAHPALRLRAEGAHGNPGLASVALVGLPGLQMVAGGQRVEAGLRRMGTEADQFRSGELLTGKHVAEHALAQTADFRLGDGGFGRSRRLGTGGGDAQAGGAGQGAAPFQQVTAIG